MNQNFIAMAKAELELKKQERQNLDIQIVMLESLLHSYGQPVSTSAQAMKPIEAPVNISRAPSGGRSPKGAAGKIIEIAKEALAGGKSMQTRELLTLIYAKGIHIGNKDPVLGVSQILSRQKHLFSSSRADGWSLKSIEPDLLAANQNSSDQVDDEL